MRSLASIVKYAGKTNFPLMILSIVRFRSSAVNGGWNESWKFIYRKEIIYWHTAPVNMSYISAPKDHLNEKRHNKWIDSKIKQTNQQLFHDHFSLEFPVPCIQSFHRMCSSVFLHISILYINQNPLISHDLNDTLMTSSYSIEYYREHLIEYSLVWDLQR
jgi:hypothetical protein